LHRSEALSQSSDGFSKTLGELGTASSMGGGFMAVFGSIFICVGLVIGGFLYFPALFDWWQSRQWVEEPCWIERVEMKTSRGSKAAPPTPLRPVTTANTGAEPITVNA